MKNVLLPDHIPLNNYEFVVAGLSLTMVTIDGLEQELETTDLPDRTKASGGNLKNFEFVATHPIHHIAEDAFLEAWLVESKLSLPTYKKPITIIYPSISGLVVRTANVFGVFPMKRKTGNLEMANVGELHVKEWTFSADDLIWV